MTTNETTALVERLRAREAKHREQIVNSQIVIDLLAPQMELFERREGYNLYAVRLSVDHQSSIRSMTKEADELSEAATALEAQASRIAELEAQLAAVRGETVAWIYENEQFGKELVLDCNSEYARRLLELGYTETPLAAIRAMKGA